MKCYWKLYSSLEKLDKDKTESKNEYNKRIEREKIDELRGMQLHGQFKVKQKIKNQNNNQPRNIHLTPSHLERISQGCFK